MHGLLDDELTLLDGTDVVTIAAIARLTGASLAHVERLVGGQLPCEASFGGVRYFRRDVALSLVASAR